MEEKFGKYKQIKKDEIWGFEVCESLAVGERKGCPLTFVETLPGDEPREIHSWNDPMD